MLPLEVKEYSKKFQKKKLIRLPILLAQIKARNKSCKLKNKVRQILCILYLHKLYLIKMMEENMIVIRDSKTFRFNLDWGKDVDANSKHEIEYIIKSRESLAENKRKNEIEKLLLKYRHGINIHENRKQQNK